MTEVEPNHSPRHFPALSNEAIKRIEDGLEKTFRTAAPNISEESWQRLAPILAAYKEEAEYLREFVNKGDVAQLNKVATRSRKLLEDLSVARQRNLLPILEGAVSPQKLKDLENALTSISRELTTTPRDKPFLEDVSRENLYVRFEAWWHCTTGEKPEIREGRDGEPPPTPFMYTANWVFNLPGMPGPTGASYKALMDLKRAARKRKGKLTALGKLLI